MPNDRRLIEVAFPLKQASLDSVHEKNVRHGHISTLHIWPARRPLAACRAALIATLLPDPGNDEERKLLLDKLGGKVVKRVKRTRRPDGTFEEKIVEETEGGILHWGREQSPDLAWFRDKIKEAYGGRAPRVLDPFAGGGAIPLEAMRLGCEVTASDINPVAWFILKCTLEYPQKLAGQTRPLPQFALESPEFMADFLKATGKGSKKGGKDSALAHQPALFAAPEADLAWHVRAWGWWVLQQARADLAHFYPVVDGKPTVAYLWARTVTCKSCRAVVPLLKTRWLCKKDNKRVLLTVTPRPDKTGVIFGVQEGVPHSSGSFTQQKEYDKAPGAGTMSRSGATCPCCGAIMTMEDIRLEGQAGRLGAVMTAVVVDGPKGKEYRLPTDQEIQAATDSAEAVPTVFAQIPFGLPEEPLPTKEALGFRVPLYGFDKWYKLFTSRQLLAMGTFVKHTRAAHDAMQKEGYPVEWADAMAAYLASSVDRLANQSTTSSRMDPGRESLEGTFSRFALPIVWDFAELAPLSLTTGSYDGAVEWIALVVSHVMQATQSAPHSTTEVQSAVSRQGEADYDLVVTDPPYYDAIPYSDAMDFFYVWLRRSTWGLSERINGAFPTPLAPKWDHDANDGELIDDASRFGGDNQKSKASYEDGMYRAFQSCDRSLNQHGRMVVVFAHKQPDAWETLVSAIIRAGFVVDGSWPIQTEMGNRTRAMSSAALSSSVWLVCKKRQETARPGWDNQVLEEMRRNIATRLHDFWDAGIRGPDFVWAATGPALEAYSKYPVVKKANEPGQVMAVSEFLRQVRRIVVDFVVGRVLSHNGGGDVVGLDDVTTYYLLHRHDFGLGDAPVGACILYAISCNLSDSALADRYDILAQSGSKAAQEDEESEEQVEGEEAEASSGSVVRLRPWQQRKRPGMGYDPATDSARAHEEAMSPHLFAEMDKSQAPTRTIPLIDQAHRLMHLWRAGDALKVDEYLDMRGLRHNALFHQLLQALIELAPEKSDERSTLESISNHVAARGTAVEQKRLVET